MAAPMFSPAGYEDSDEEFDEDGFHIGARASKKTDFSERDIQSMTSHPVNGFSNLSKNKNFNNASNSTSSKTSAPVRSPEKRPAQNGKRKITVEDLRLAITRRQTDIVREYLQQGLDVNEALKGGWTCLMYAANDSNCELVKMLLEHGAEANFHKDLYTVLMAACSSRECEDSVLECTKLLVGNGADVNAHDRYHMSPLIYAAREGKSKVVDNLIESGAKVDKQDSRGWTALTWSSSRGHKDTVKMLLQHNADPLKKHIDKQTAVDIAYSYGHKEIGCLLENKPFDEEKKLTNSPLHSVVNEPPSNHSSKSLTASNFIATSPEKKETEDVELQYKRHDELDLFLMGLELDHLIPVVREHQVDFVHFLRASENDLISMGITQIGVRRKIIDALQAVHKKEWETSSLPSLTMINKQIKCSDAVAMCTNISRHIRYTGSHIGFIYDQLSTYPQILEDSSFKGGAGSVQLMGCIKELSESVSIMDKELVKLQKVLNRVSPGVEVSDLIDASKKEKPNRKWKYLRRTVFFTMIGVLIYKRQEVYTAITTLAHRYLPSTGLVRVVEG